MSEIDERGPCPHGEVLFSRCTLCKDLPEIRRRTVYITSGGNCYHYDINCDALEHGQTQVDERGGLRSERKPTYEDVIKYERNPCQICVPNME
jgi:hypothetical protein